jgi:hypothetical protein
MTGHKRKQRFFLVFGCFTQYFYLKTALLLWGEGGFAYAGAWGDELQIK